MFYEHTAPSWRVLLAIVVGLVFGSFELASAASVSITWADNSSNEDGFRIVCRRRGHAIKVGAGPTVATHRLRDPTAVRRWLDRLARAPR